MDKAEVLVMNDGSTDRTSEVLKLFPKIGLIETSWRKGTPKCWNDLVRLSTRSGIFTIPDDVRIVGNPVKFIERLIADLRIGLGDIVGVNVNDRTARPEVPGWAKWFAWHLAGQVFNPRGGEPRKTPFVPGTMAFNREIWEDVGGFDEALIHTGFREETDFQLRANRAGYQVFFDPRLELDHLEVRTGGQYDEPERERWILENQRHFLKRNFPRSWRYKMAFFRGYRWLK